MTKQIRKTQKKRQIKDKKMSEQVYHEKPQIYISKIYEINSFHMYGVNTTIAVYKVKIDS